MAKQNIQGMAELVKRAKDDPKFFHSLIWNTEDALSSVGFLSRNEKAEIMKIDPEDLVIGLATGQIGSAADGDTCGASCGGSCGGSCGISCGVSCATSCAVSELVVDPGTAVSTPTAVDFQKDMLARSIDNELSRRRFSSFRR